mgnify:CR=1 FL=1
MGKKNILWHTVRAFIAIVVIILCITGTYRVPVMAYTGVPVHASSSWIDDTSIYFGNGVGNQDEIECEEGKGEKNWLAKAFAEVLFSMADGLLSLLNKMHLNMDLMIFGRVHGVAAASGIMVDGEVTAPYTFELTYGNIYGATAGIMYGMLRSICIGFMTVYFVYKLAKASYVGTGRQLAEVKDGLLTFILSALLAYIMPNIVDVMLYIRDVVLYQEATFLQTVGGTPSVTANMWAAYNARPIIVNALMCLGACGLTIYFGASYIGLAVGMTILFAAFPVTAVVAQYDKKLLTNWCKEVLGSALTPCFDCLLLIIPCIMGKYIPWLYAVQFCMCFMIIPARQILKITVGITSVTANTMGMAAFGGVMAGLNVARAVTRTAGMAAFGVGRYAVGKVGGAASDMRMAKTEGALAKAEADERSAAIQEADGSAVRGEIQRLDAQAVRSEGISKTLRATGIKGTPGEADAYDNLSQTAGKEAESYRQLAGEASARAQMLRNSVNADMPDNERREIMANAEALDDTAASYMMKAESSQSQAAGYKKKADDSRTIIEEDSRAAELRQDIKNIQSDATNRRIAGVQRLAAVNGTTVDEEDASLNAMESARIDDLTRNGERINSDISGIDVDIADKDVALNKARDVYKADKAAVNDSRQKLSEARRAYTNFMERGGGSDADRSELRNRVSEAEEAYSTANTRMAESEGTVDRIESERSNLRARRARLLEERNKNNTALANAKDNMAVYSAAHDAGIGRDGNINNVYGISRGRAGGNNSVYGNSAVSAGLGAPAHPMSEYEAKVIDIRRKAVNYKNFDRLGEMEGVQLSHAEKAQFYRKRAIMRTAQGLGGAVGGTVGMTAGMAVGGAVGLGLETYTLGHTGGAFAGLGASTGGMAGTIAGTAAGSMAGTGIVHGAYGGMHIVTAANDNFLSPPPVMKAAAAGSINHMQAEQAVEMTSDTKVNVKQGKVTTVGISGQNEAIENIQKQQNTEGQQISAPPATIKVEQQYDIQRLQSIHETTMQAQAVVNRLQQADRNDVNVIMSKNPNMATRDLAVELVVGNNAGGEGIDRAVASSAVKQAFDRNPALARQLEELRK